MGIIFLKRKSGLNFKEDMLYYKKYDVGSCFLLKPLSFREVHYLKKYPRTFTRPVQSMRRPFFMISKISCKCFPNPFSPCISPAEMLYWTTRARMLRAGRITDDKAFILRRQLSERISGCRDRLRADQGLLAYQSRRDCLFPGGRRSGVGQGRD